jgi:hypothetical protein
MPHESSHPGANACLLGSSQQHAEVSTTTVLTKGRNRTIELGEATQSRKSNAENEAHTDVFTEVVETSKDTSQKKRIFAVATLSRSIDDHENDRDHLKPNAFTRNKETFAQV